MACETVIKATFTSIYLLWSVKRVEKKTLNKQMLKLLESILVLNIISHCNTNCKNSTIKNFLAPSNYVTQTENGCTVYFYGNG